MQIIISRASSSLHGEFCLPADKSISHRVLILASLAEGESHIYNLLLSEDTLATLHALEQLGVSITLSGNDVRVKGVGLTGLKASTKPLDLKNAGTGARLLAGVLSAQPFKSVIIGDASLSKRPMARIVDPLRKMGASITMTAQDTLPMQVDPAVELIGIHYALPVASAQVKSSLLLAGLYATGQTTLIEAVATRDHTERLLPAFGYSIVQANQCVSLWGGSTLKGITMTLPGDFSSAAFFIVAATLIPGSDLVLKGVGINPTRVGLVTLLKNMGANIVFQNEISQAGEPVADIRVQAACLTGIDVPLELIPSAIDEFPILFIAAACATGVTRLHHAEELRHKESDRIAVMAKGLQQLGVSVQTLSDGLVVEGGKLIGGEVDCAGDHRVAMAFAIAGSVSESPVIIRNTACVATSFPDFTKQAQAMGLAITEE